MENNGDGFNGGNYYEDLRKRCLDVQEYRNAQEMDLGRKRKRFVNEIGSFSLSLDMASSSSLLTSSSTLSSPHSPLSLALPFSPRHNRMTSPVPQTPIASSSSYSSPSPPSSTLSPPLSPLSLALPRSIRHNGMTSPAPQTPIASSSRYSSPSPPSHTLSLSLSLPPDITDNWMTSFAPQTPIPSSSRYSAVRSDPYLSQPWLASTSMSLPIPPPPPPLVSFFNRSHQTLATSVRTTSVAESSQSSKAKKKKQDMAPYLWATDERATIHSLEYLRGKGINMISGQIFCKSCQKVQTISYNLEEKFLELKNFIVMNKMEMRDRAPCQWTHPEPDKCPKCGKGAKPVIDSRKYKINWLFLLLGQTLGFCTLEQLKNFCKHADHHKTGAKDRVLYLTYMGLCKMLEPNTDIFDR